MLSKTINQIKLFYWKKKFYFNGYTSDEARAMSWCKVYDYPYVERGKRVPIQ